jgi:hypothetical protein
MKPFRLLSAFALTLAFFGCVRLKTVQDFASESAKFSEYTELTTRFRDTYQREQPYLHDQAMELAQASDQRRRDAYPDLLKIHHGLSLYLRTLAVLAGDKTFEPPKKLEGLAAEIKAHPDLGLDAKQVDAYSNLSRIVANWLASGYQQKAVREMLRQGDPPLQTLLGGMTSLVGYYQKTNENEKRTVLGLLEMEIPYADTPKDRLLATLAKAHLQAKIREYELADARYVAAEKGLQSIREGHRKLVEDADSLSSEEARLAISMFTKDIKAIRNDLQALHSW